jgi:hypothetical protein
MEIGTGVAICGCAFAGVMLIYRVLPPRNEMMKNIDPRCADHSGVCKAIENIESWLESISKDVKHLLERKSHGD